MFQVHRWSHKNGIGAQTTTSGTHGRHVSESFHSAFNIERYTQVCCACGTNQRSQLRLEEEEHQRIELEKRKNKLSSLRAHTCNSDHTKVRRLQIFWLMDVERIVILSRWAPSRRKISSWWVASASWQKLGQISFVTYRSGKYSKWVRPENSNKLTHSKKKGRCV